MTLGDKQTSSVAQTGNWQPVTGTAGLQQIPTVPHETQIEADLLQITNAHRATLTGVSSVQLVPDPLLLAISYWKACDMADRMYMQHDQPEGGGVPASTISDRFTAGGWSAYYAWGENIAYGLQTAQDCFNAWMSDIGHRQNLEGPWNVCGFAVVTAKNGLRFAVQDFGYIPGKLPPGPPVTPPPPQLIAAGQKWQRHSTRVTGTVTAVTQSGVTWKGRGLPVTRTFAQFRLQFTYISG